MIEVFIDFVLAVFFGGFAPIIMFIILSSKLNEYFHNKKKSDFISACIIVPTALMLFMMNYGSALQAIENISSKIAFIMSSKNATTKQEKSVSEESSKSGDIIRPGAGSINVTGNSSVSNSKIFNGTEDKNR